MTAPLLRVEGLGVTVQSNDSSYSLLENVGFDIARGDALGVVGESGAGKSTLAMSLLGMLPQRGAYAASTRLQLDGAAIDHTQQGVWRTLRGRKIGTVFQEPLLALDPSFSIGDHLQEAVLVHQLDQGSAARDRAVAALARVGFADAGDALRKYPHELSGGMRQRALIAAAIVLEPQLLIADEPTTALDVTLQAQVLDLLDELRASMGLSVLLISHDLDVVAERCARALVLERGQVVEAAAVEALLRAPESAAANRLSAARRSSTKPLRAHDTIETGTNASQLVPDAGKPSAKAPLLSASDVEVRFPAPLSATHRERRATHAVRGVSLHVAPGEAVGIVGESGCGKSSLARALLRLGPLTAGRVRLADVDLATLDAEPLRAIRRRMQFVSQDAGASLTPHCSVRQLIAEGIEVHRLASGRDADARVDGLLERFGLDARMAAARPTELSSGQRQRVALARALAVEPELLVCDEPVASLDAALRADVLAHLDALRRERGMAIVLISHDLGAVRRIADRIYVMYHGRVVESGTTQQLARSAMMPYTKTLLAAGPTGSPRAGRRRIAAGQVPAAVSRIQGCPFEPRCEHLMKDQVCVTALPALRSLDDGRSVACWKVGDGDVAHTTEGVR